jgi:hypothetical protein
LNILIPLIIFLVLLALGQIFNREPTVPIRRPGTGGGSALGPRPAIGGSSWTTAARDDSRPRPERSPERQPRPAQDGGIIILGTNVAAPPGVVFANPQEVEALARKNRRRPSRQQPAARRQEKPNTPAAPPRLTSTTTVDLTASHLERVQSVAAFATQDQLPSVSAEMVSSALRDPIRVREALVVGIVLQPPVAARRLARMRGAPR